MNELSRQLQTALGNTYDIERELGGGGMSRVFLAMESALGRRVVIKVLTPELAQGLSAERFAREIKLAAALQDPHIVPVLAAGVAEGLPYYTMPFVEGESLRALLLRTPVAYNESIGILRDVALALEYAHARGIIHRDIKPENVLLAGRTAVVADFGIAKAVSAARTIAPGTSPSGTLTSIGQSLGTPAYMAPEQAAGDPVDARADLYAWGVMAYELLAGRHPFADKATAAQLMAAHVTEAPAPLADKKPGLPPPVAALVMRCLAKDPNARPQSAADVVQALDAVNSPAGADSSLGAATPALKGRNSAASTVASPKTRIPVAAMALGVALVLGIGGYLYAKRSSGASTHAASADAEPSATADVARAIAVLPFENLGDSAEAYFADGITDAVRSKLVSLQGVRVIARGSSNQYRATKKSPSDIAKELGVRYLLTGTVRFANGSRTSRVQVSPELVEVAQQGAPQTRWSEPFDAEVKDVFKVQGDIASKVASSMQVALGGTAQAQLTVAPTRDPEAYDAYLRGQSAWDGGARTDPAALRRAVGFFEQAVTRDSNMVDAWANLSVARSLLYSSTTSTPQKDSAALHAANRVVQLAPNQAVSHWVMGKYLRNIKNDLARAAEEFALARNLAPGDAGVLSELAAVRGELGQLDEELQVRDAALAIDPLSTRNWSGKSTALLRLHRFDEALAAGEHALLLSPTALNIVERVVFAYAGKGDLAGARKAIVAASQDTPTDQLLAYLATYQDMAWVLDSASQRTLITLDPSKFDNDRATWALVRAQTYTLFGENALARAWGDSAVREFEIQLRPLPRDPQLNVLRGLALAYAGRARESREWIDRGLQLEFSNPANRTSINYAYFVWVAARAAFVAGDRDTALARLSEVLQLHFFVSPGWLRIDPTWKSLKGDPRFEKLIATP